MLQAYATARTSPKKMTPSRYPQQGPIDRIEFGKKSIDLGVAPTKNLLG